MSLIIKQTLKMTTKSKNAKKLVSVRYSPEVLEYFKSTGVGWQSRMDSVLKDYVSRRAADRSGVA